MSMDPPNNFQEYGHPLYSAAWLPDLRKFKPHDDGGDDDDDEIKSQTQTHTEVEVEAEAEAEEEAEAETETETQTKTKTETDLTQFDPNQNHLILAGGGGEGRSGISNAIFVAQFDSASVALSRQPVAKLNTGSELPYRMAVHPGGDGLICSFPNSCRLFELDQETNGEVPKLSVRRSERVLDQLQDVGQQLALTFNNEGSLLAAGGEDGKLRVFKWPSMEIILNEAQAHSVVKQLDFSPDGKFLVSLGNGGPGRVWDVTSSTVVASLPAGTGQFFCGCRFSIISDGSQILYIADKSGSIVTWSTTTWERIGSKTIARDIISFDVSADGKLLACGTSDGDLVIVNLTTMRIQKADKKAHRGFVTALSFSHDSRVLASASMDSSARVSTVEKEKGRLNIWVIILIILVAIGAYFTMNPENLPSFNS